MFNVADSFIALEKGGGHGWWISSLPAFFIFILDEPSSKNKGITMIHVVRQVLHWTADRVVIRHNKSDPRLDPGSFNIAGTLAPAPT